MQGVRKRELQLLQAATLDALLEALTEGLRASYDLSYCSLVLCDPDHDIRHLLLANGTPAESFDNLIMMESLSGVAPQYIALSRPWQGAYAACDHQLICPAAAGAKSMAMLPIVFRGELIGSINFCSSNSDGFKPDETADDFEHLARIASLCLENAINRARLLRSGFTDALTGWHNRHYFQVRLNEELARARRDGTRLVCLMLDIDHFKCVGDNWGHAAGDEALREVAQRVDLQVRASDIAARYAGEQFVVLMPDTDVGAAQLLAERIRHALAETPIDLANGAAVSLTGSIGIAEVQLAPEADDLKTVGDSLMARAGVALYAAKSAGRDRVVIEGG
jgi:two-component system cell cycle response regulator